MTGVVTFSWYFILGPTVMQGGETLFAKIVSTAYPLCDLVLISCLLLLAARANEGATRLAVGLLALALATIVITDSIYDYQSLNNAYNTGGLLDVGWPLGFMMMGLSARVLRLAGATPQRSTGSEPGPPSAPVAAPRLWRSLLPYAFIPAVGLLLIYTWHTHGHDALKAGVVLGVAVLIVLVVLRQIVAMRELHDMYTNNEALSAANAQLEVMATTDALTSLPNRTLLYDRLEQALHMAQRQKTALALLLLDLDRFKDVNDTLGHQCGDLLLQQIGPRLQSLVRASDTVARLGGDEFAALLPATEAAGAIHVAHKLLNALSAPFLVEGQTIDVGASIGIALCPDHGLDAATLLRCADVAMYMAKRSHRDYAVYVASADQHSPRRLALMSELRQAITHDRLVLHYQPKVSLATGGVCGVEALLRWPHPEHGFIAPDTFIPLAEHTGLIAPLTEWVLHTALRQSQDWQRRGLHLGMAVNLSMRTLHDERFPALVKALLRQYAIAPQRLTLEITESSVMADPERAIDVIRRLGETGVRVAIDDFGTGYSSLGYLKQLPAHEIKIDKSFVLSLGAEANEVDASIVRSVTTLVQALGREVVVEGVEGKEAWDLLLSMGCDVAQGYFLSRPLPAAELERWVRTSPWGRERASA
jgi:diguanylate cyclase (GGDEF)-like protein